jgi:hypothetical protein
MPLEARSEEEGGNSFRPARHRCRAALLLCATAANTNIYMVNSMGFQSRQGEGREQQADRAAGDDQDATLAFFAATPSRGLSMEESSGANPLGLTIVDCAFCLGVGSQLN